MLVGAVGRRSLRLRSPALFQKAVGARTFESTSGRAAPEDYDWSKWDQRYANREEVMNNFFDKGGEDGTGQRIPQYKIAATEWKHRYRGELPEQQSRNWREWTDPRLHLRDPSKGVSLPFGFMVVTTLWLAWQITLPITGSYGSYPIYAAVPYVKAMIMDFQYGESFEQAKQDCRVKKYNVVDHWTEQHTLEKPTELGRVDVHPLEALQKL